MSELNHRYQCDPAHFCYIQATRRRASRSSWDGGEGEGEAWRWSGSGGESHVPEVPFLRTLWRCLEAEGEYRTAPQRKTLALAPPLAPALAFGLLGEAVQEWAKPCVAVKAASETPR